MADKNVVLEKSLAFATKVELLCREIQRQKKEFDHTRQLMRSSSSIGANISEAQYAASKADFVCRLKIAEKEANESSYWIIFLHNTRYIEDDDFYGLFDANNQIKRLLSSILNSCKRNTEEPSVKKK